MDETELIFNEQQLVRRGKLAELQEKGMEPYPARLPRERTHTAVEAIAAYREGRLAEGELVTLVGRMLTLRVMGKAAFAHIEDGSSRIQIYVKRDVVGEATYEETFKRLIDLGDFITVTGAMFTTRTGEVTCEVRELALIGKTLNPAARQVAWPEGHRDALSPALRRPAGQPRGARRFPHARPDRQGRAPLPG